AAGDERLPAAPVLRGDRGGEKVVGLVPRRLGVGEPARGHKFRQNFELIDQFVVELPAALVTRQQFLTVGWRPERIQADDYAPWPVALIEPQQEIGEPDNRAAAAVAAPPDRFGQGVIGAVRERIAVDDKQRSGHESSGLVKRSILPLSAMGTVIARMPYGGR